MSPGASTMISTIGLICTDVLVPVWKGIRDMIVVWACLRYLGFI